VAWRAKQRRWSCSIKRQQGVACDQHDHSSGMLPLFSPFAGSGYSFTGCCLPLDCLSMQTVDVNCQANAHRVHRTRCSYCSVRSAIHACAPGVNSVPCRQDEPGQDGAAGDQPLHLP
jgi:hypothetical protein